MGAAELATISFNYSSMAEIPLTIALGLHFYEYNNKHNPLEFSYILYPELIA